MRVPLKRVPRWAVRALSAAVLAAAIPVIAWNGFVQQVGAQFTDILLRLRAPAHTQGVRDVVLVAIDDATAAVYGPLPLRRSTLAEGLEALLAFHPKVVALDLLISEPERAEASASGAGLAAASGTASVNEPAAASGGKSANETASELAPESGDAELVRAIQEFPHAVVSAALDAGAANERWILPLPELAGIATTAHVHAAQDPDGVVRSIELAKAAGRHRYWALALQTVRLAQDAGLPVERAKSVSVGDIAIPASEASGRMMLINCAGPEGTFRRVPFSALLNGTADPNAFRNKIVIIGVTAQGSGDRLYTPVSTMLGMSGIEIHANAARTILDRAFLVPFGPIGEYGACAAVALLCFLFARSLRGWRLALTLVTTAVAIPVVCGIALRFGSVWPLGALGAVFLFSAAVAGTGEYSLVWAHLRAEERKRREYAFRVQAIAHEIKTPLTAIQGSSEIVADELMPEKTRVEVAGLIHKESKRLTAIVEAFLNVERMATGTLALEKQTVEALPFFDDVLERARLYAGRKRIQVNGDVRVSTLAGDPDLLSFAVYNLLTNAVKYSPKGTTVSLSAVEQDEDVLIAVEDHGYGIAPADRERIFERFYRLKRDEKGPEAGTGIGLALVREIVTQHGGNISVDSRAGEGSRFTITLPK